MRIVFLSWRDLAHPQAGGSEYVVDKLASGLSQRGHTVTLLCGGPVGTRGYATIDIGGRFTQYVHAPWKARLGRHADVVVDVENGIPFFAPLWTSTPVVCMMLHVHTDQWDMYFPKPIARVGYALEHRAMPRVYRRSQFVAISPSTAEQLSRLGIDEDSIETVIMGTDPDRSTIAERAREPLFVVLGRLVPHKRVDLALHLWEQVRPQTGGTLVIVGDGPEREHLESSAGVGVEFAGHVTEREKRRLLAEAWILIHPAAHEGWGLVIMEGASASTPTIGFDVVGVRDAVIHNETGLLAQSTSDFIEAWVRLANDGDERARLGAAARKWALACDWESATDKFEAVLLSAAQKTTRRRFAIPNA